VSENKVSFQKVRSALDVNYESIKDASIKTNIEAFEKEYNEALAREELEEIGV